MRAYAATAALLALLFVAFSLAVAARFFTGSDADVAAAFNSIWVPGLLPLFRGYALLGGIEATGLIALGLFAFLWRRGYRLGALVAAGLPLDTLTELLYKHTINHPAPPRSLSHPDGPSLSELFEGPPGSGWSYPSGHMARTVLVYGLAAFVLQRLVARPRARRAAAPALVIVVLMAFDRLYLEVHWVSDVIGGLLLGATFLAASITWLEWSEARAAK